MVSDSFCTKETGNQVHAPPPFDDKAFYYFPLELGKVRISLPEWLCLCSWTETNLRSFGLNQLRAVRQEIKSSSEFLILLKYIEFDETDHDAESCSLKYLTKNDLRTALDLLLSKHILLRPSEFLSQNDDDNAMDEGVLFRNTRSNNPEFVASSFRDRATWGAQVMQ